MRVPTLDEILRVKAFLVVRSNPWVAQAQLEGTVLVTADPKLRAYDVELLEVQAPLLSRIGNEAAVPQRRLLAHIPDMGVGRWWARGHPRTIRGLPTAREGFPMDTSRPVHIINVPLDLGASRRGTDAGPSAMRIAGLSAALANLGFTLSMETDIPVAAPETHEQHDPHLRYKKEILATCRTLAQTVRRALELGEIPLVIGGDHSIAMGTISGIASYMRARDQRLGVLWFDAHGDMNIPEGSPSGNIHGMPLSHLLGHGDRDLVNIADSSPALAPQNVVLLGLRDLDKRERELIRESGVKAYTMRDIDERGMNHVAREALEIVNDGTSGFHVSFDVDGCDPSVIPGSGTLVPGGVSYREAHLLLELCAEHGAMTSMELVELNPFIDTGNVSAERAVELIKSAFGSNIL